MTLASGTKLGPYEILAPLGAGGMGEVYRARDARVDRAVALKVLPEEFFESEERRGRFEREARTLASLNHPGIAHLYSFEEIPSPSSSSSRHLLVMELVEGEGLDQRIASGSLSLEETLSVSRQIAEALEAAHEKGIVHRDLKPANVRVTPDGRVKLLDFGLAKIFDGDAGPGSSPSVTHSPTLTARGTAAGVILGTAAYMSPEQARGKPVDKRTDVWAFGCVLFEMLTGKRAFEGETVTDVLAAVLTRDPDWAALPAGTPERVREILGKCLRRDAKLRLRDIGDARLDLEEVGPPGPSGAFTLEEKTAVPDPTVASAERTKRERGSKRRLYFSWAIAAACAAAAGALALRARAPRVAPALTWHRLTFENGTVLSAGFASGSKVVYSAAWGGAPSAVYSTGIDFSESKVLVPAPSKLLSVSKSGEMAVLLRAKPLGWFAMEGTLARVPADGGAPRELLEKVMDAAWSPDGSQLAIVRRAGGKVRLEFPPGRVLYETFGEITSPRFSPKGDRIAFADHPAKRGNWGTVSVVDLEGRRSVWSPIYEVIEGLVWAPSGQEVWFGAEGARNAIQLFAASPGQKPRLVAEVPGDLAPLAIGPDGRMLVNRLSHRSQIACALGGDSRPRDLASLGSSLLGDLSPDGKKVLLTYRGPGAQSSEGDVVLRPTDGDSFVRLGRGAGMALSPDGRWAAAVLWGNDAFTRIWASEKPSGAPPRTDSPPVVVDSIVLLPTGAGDSRTLPMGGLAIIRAIGFHPDHRRLIVSGSNLGEAERIWSREMEGGAPPRPISPPGLYALSSAFLSPDGRWAAAVDGDDALWLVPVDGGEPKRMPGVEDGEMFAGWAGDGKAIHVFRYSGKLIIHRVEFPTGVRRQWKEAFLPDTISAQEPSRVVVARDADAWAAGYESLLGELYVVAGLK
ncbi:MAG: protein kinase [Acidobacteria bacterium]|nr:protein kinase [Acidobacteriota bacterium]